MNWETSDSALQKRNLRQVNLEALNPDCNQSDIMLYQHHGGLSANDVGIFNVDQTLASKKHLDLFRLAFEKQPNLLLTPEYSCPWSVIANLLANHVWPSNGKAWVVGCESISPTELAAFQGEHTGTEVIFSDYLLQEGKTFFDPVCILMNAVDVQGNQKKVLFIQFKGYAMADRTTFFEPNSLILGRQRFIFRNNDNSIQMVVFICADSLQNGILSSLPSWQHLPYLILHIQMNPAPRHIGFREYRDQWGNQNRQNIEIVCLNWSRQSTAGNLTLDSGGSAWYSKSPEIQASDLEVNEAHSHGIYYSESSDRYFHCFMLNYDEHIFFVKYFKHSQVDSHTSTHRQKVGPLPIETFAWNLVQLIWEKKVNPDDGFLAQCERTGVDLSPLVDPDMSPVDRERLVSLICGDIKKWKKPWPHVRSIGGFFLDANEVSHRINFCHDPDQLSKDSRQAKLMKINVLKNEVFSATTVFPDSFEVLKANGSIRYPAVIGNFSYNVSNMDGESPATFVYLGEAFDSDAQNKHSELGGILGEAKRELVVWYKLNSALKFIHQKFEHLASDTSESTESITRG